MPENELHAGAAHGHPEDKNTILRIALNLTATCLISGLILAGTYYITHPIALEKSAMLEALTMQELVTEADTFEEVDGMTDWYAAEKDGEIIAYVVPAETKGYGGTIELLVAVSIDGTVIDYSITDANETPGLGDRTADEDFRSRLWGKTSDQLTVVKDPSNTENVQAITGATISSKAVTKGVKAAVDEVVEYLGG